MLSLGRFLMIQRASIRRTPFFWPTCKPVSATLRGYRGYTNKPAKSQDRSSTGPGFTIIFGLAIIGTLIFNEAAKNLDKNKPSNSFTEEEYEHVMEGLKRRIAMFPDGQLDVRFSLSHDSTSLTKLFNDSMKIIYIDPGQVVENCRSSTNDPYEPLLNEIHLKYGPDYLSYLPNGLLVNLLGRYMKDHCKQGDHVVILDFPHSIRDAIKFENEVSTVSMLLTPKELLDSDICKYYQTVHKTRQL